MLKSRNPLFNKTTKKAPSFGQISQQNQIKARRSYIKLSKNHPNLVNIIQNLQKNVHDLKNYHESLQKINKNKLQKSCSLNEINRFRCSSKNKIKNFLPATSSRKLKGISESTQNKENKCFNSKDPVIESTVSKYIPQNGSTMLSMLNADVDEVKKAYSHIYGKQNTNIVDLYNFFKKNVQKSTRIHGSQIQISRYPQGQNSEYLKKSRQQLPRKSNQFLNVIVEDRLEKQILPQSQNKLNDECSSIYKVSAQKNPTMEEIFKNGCPDLANVFDFVKKRRVSLKNYMKTNRNKEEKNQNSSKIQMKKSEPTELNGQKKVSLKPQSIQKNQSTPLFGQAWSNHKKQIIQESHLSNQKYLPSKSSKKSHKSSLKKSKQKDIDLDANIESPEIKDFNCGLHDVQNSAKQNDNNQNKILVSDLNDSQSKKMQIKFEKFKKSKYYVEPVPKTKQISLQDSSISMRSSSRIIELDFIPLDL